MPAERDVPASPPPAEADTAVPLSPVSALIGCQEPGLQRPHMLQASIGSKNKKLQQQLLHADHFRAKWDEVRLRMRQEGAATAGAASGAEKASDDASLLLGVDTTVCVRIRPLLPYEREAGLFPVVTPASGRDDADAIAPCPSAVALEPRLSVRGRPSFNESRHDADLCLGADADNGLVYERLKGADLVRLGLDGGVSTVLAYGQTGSGKTFTISGILERLANDLFRERDASFTDADGKPTVRLWLSFFELLGGQASDLLEPLRDNSSKKRSIEIMEDAFGHVNARHAREVELTDGPGQFERLVKDGLERRKTAATFKNDTSSRSHAVCRIRISNEVIRESEDGQIFVIDLAGSENAADSQFHDSARQQEKQAINFSLMALKDCIRHRALSAVNVDKIYHVPYRNSKLTLLLKDAFELKSRKRCRTVVVACVSPSCADVAQTLSTLRYAAPIKVVGRGSRDAAPPNPRNPANWDNAALRRWVEKASRGGVDAELLCPYESGMQLLRLPEAQFIQRVMRNAGYGEKKAKEFYLRLWKMMVDARTKQRSQKLRERKKLSMTTYEDSDNNDGQDVEEEDADKDEDDQAGKEDDERKEEEEKGTAGLNGR